MTSSLGARTCGAFHRSMANTLPAWKTCSTSTPKRRIPSDPSSASMKARSSSSARYASQFRPNRASLNATITSTAATAPSISSSSSTCIVPGATSRSPSGALQKTTPNACASSSMSTIPMPSTFGSCRTTCRPTRLAPSMRLFRPPKPGAFCAAWSSTTPPSTPVGSTWSRSRSACCAASAWIAESTTQSGSVAKSQLGNGSEMPPAPASNGCSQPTKPAPKWVTHTPTHRKSHNHCAEVLASLHLLLHRKGLAPSTPCRSPGALRKPSQERKFPTSFNYFDGIFFQRRDGEPSRLKQPCGRAAHCLLCRRRLHAGRLPVLSCGLATDELSERQRSAGLGHLGRQRHLIVGIVLQRRRDRAGEFHECANLARIHEAKLDLALGDHLLARVEADDLHLRLDRVHDARRGEDALDHDTATVGHGRIANADRFCGDQRLLERVGGRDVGGQCGWTDHQA